MHALYILVPVLCILAIAYRYYSAFIAAKVMSLDDSRVTPAHTKYDGHNYYPTSRWVLFGHHFAAITGAGPLLGPVLAAQFGYAPGLIWLVAGVASREPSTISRPWGLARRAAGLSPNVHRNRFWPASAQRSPSVLVVIAMPLGLAVVGPPCTCAVSIRPSPLVPT